MTAQTPKCSACNGKCRWAEDAWVCTKCGYEWCEDHSPEFAPPGAEDGRARPGLPGLLLTGAVSGVLGLLINELGVWFALVAFPSAVLLAILGAAIDDRIKP